MRAMWLVFFHPDCYRRPWSFTRSADPAQRQALAGFHRRWGFTPRPEDVRQIQIQSYAFCAGLPQCVRSLHTVTQGCKCEPNQAHPSANSQESSCKAVPAAISWLRRRGHRAHGGGNGFSKALCNPHDSHMGGLDCLLCRHVHKKSENFCAQCHWWKYTVP